MSKERKIAEEILRLHVNVYARDTVDADISDVIKAMEEYHNQFTPQVKVTDEEIDEAAIKFCNEHCEPTNGDLTLETEIFSAGVKWGLSRSASSEIEGEALVALKSIRSNYELWKREELADGAFSFHLHNNLLAIEKCLNIELSPPPTK